MDNNRPSEGGGDGLGADLESLLAKVSPPKAPAWFATRTMARLREEGVSPRSWIQGWRWIWSAGVAAVLLIGWIRWEATKTGSEISDAKVFAALDALAEQEEENRWWAGL